MKVKYPYNYKNLINTNYQRYLCEELEKHSDIEIVSEDKYSNLSIDISSNCDTSIIIDRSDPHGNLIDFDVDSFVVPELQNMSMEIYNISKDTLTPSIVWSDRKKESSIIDKIDMFNFYSPSFITESHNKFIKKFRHAKLFILPYSLPEKIFYISKEKSLDVFFCGAVNKWYPYRKMFFESINNMKNLKYLMLQKSGAGVKNTITTTFEYDMQLFEYANNIRKSKITLIDGGIFNYPVKKYIESMACGCLVLGPIPKYGLELGYIDGETMVEINRYDYKEKLMYYLNNDKERERITSNAYELFKEKYTCKKTVNILLENFNSI